MKTIDKTLGYPLMLVSIENAWNLESGMMQALKREMPRLYEHVSDEHYQVWIFNSIEELIEVISEILSSDGISIDFMNDKEMLKFIAQDGKEHFIISKTNWNESKIQAIARLYGNKIIQSMKETAKEHIWLDLDTKS